MQELFFHRPQEFTILLLLPYVLNGGGMFVWNLVLLTPGFHFWCYQIWVCCTRLINQSLLLTKMLCLRQEIWSWTQFTQRSSSCQTKTPQDFSSVASVKVATWPTPFLWLFQAQILLVESFAPVDWLVWDKTNSINQKKQLMLRERLHSWLIMVKEIWLYLWWMQKLLTNTTSMTFTKVSPNLSLKSTQKAG